MDEDEPVERLRAIGPYTWDKDTSGSDFDVYTWRGLPELDWGVLQLDLLIVVCHDASNYDGLFETWHQFRARRKCHADALCHAIIQAFRASGHVSSELGSASPVEAILKTCQEAYLCIEPDPDSSETVVLSACFHLSGLPQRFVFTFDEQRGEWP